MIHAEQIAIALNQIDATEEEADKWLARLEMQMDLFVNWPETFARRNDQIAHDGFSGFVLACGRLLAFDGQSWLSCFQPRAK